MKKSMFAPILLWVLLLSTGVKAQDQKIETVNLQANASIGIFDQDGQISSELNAQRPSCEMVKHRLQEYYKRTAEAEIFLDWYSPEKMGVEQSAALLNLLKRTPFFINERLHENVKITYKWELSKTTFEELSRFKIWPKEFTYGNHHWADPFSGYLPQGVEFEIYERQKIIALLSFNMSYENFCLGNPDSILKITTENLVVNFLGTHHSEKL